MMTAKHVRTGYYGEKYVKTMLENQGYEVQYTDDNFCGDLRVYDPVTGNIFRLEVKTSNRNLSGVFNFCLYRQGKTDCNHADVIALVFRDKRKTQVRFIDANYVGHLKNLHINKLPIDYTGKYKSMWQEGLHQVS